MRRIYHPYWAWEDFQNGMWSPVYRKERLAKVREAFLFTGDADLYGRWMLRVIDEWPIACEHNLTEPSMNRLAWIGHAAVSMAKGIPEHVTREAWGLLTDEQRYKANNQAEIALHEWIKRHQAKNRRMAHSLGVEGLF